MIEYRKARKEEADDLLDFLNYVFSQARCPHDFKKYNPEMYDSGYPFWEEHYVAVEDGHIRATVALTRMQNQEKEQGMVRGYIGAVSVHPYHRGKNYMRILMGMAIEDMKKGEFDYSLLEGQRQRYGYFSYEPGNYRFRFEINATNIRHVLAGKKPEVILQKDEKGYSFRVGEKQVGIWDRNGLQMEDNSLTADAIAAYFKETGKTEICIDVPLYEIGRTEVFSRICESVSVMAPVSLIRIFHFRRFLEVGLRKRAQAGLCEEGQISIQVGEERFGLQVVGMQVRSFDVEQAEYVFEPEELQRLALSLTASAADGRFPHGWFPISL